ncbi:MAG: hypothetical protein JGK12_15330 [Microcoleus sp. PH2017_01_SCD_O_A]|uniref:hypothetical protein n=1 Tax=Microcoleus sp. PH2017_01_SCD_O_A TaxID=2798812 RepID=UPI001D3D2640|nr:hypothetical protein [Microcoleus sp. PH2017_01_SCD_O_A]MCC3417111.1 hypothetical protein [Microcoleus sp. PH2017_07_MST_O_A]MCC3431629.1 hypothetical protein [Microcoleus sp. PH2017_04_SCI_O_A]MCC3511553.1 hypothetical protein [Microcoleus sp. PH2017_17_BER_D_A]TAE69963.1 MAG: hypothetical protein EAZ86_08175 [Oscillatoriales cyanobacterium]MCC3425263.1 hypothetical protein [Microcoleus sp. PH2017_01_SCD_O_A]
MIVRTSALRNSISGAQLQDTASIAPQTDIRLQKDLLRPDSRFEIKKLCDRSAIDGQRVISSFSQFFIANSSIAQ